MMTDAKWNLPDPFLRPDGTRALTAVEWPAQREYWKQYLQEHFYGTLPPRPDHVTGSRVDAQVTRDASALREIVRLTTGPEDRIGWNIFLTRPLDSEKHPCILIPGDRPLEASIEEAVIRAGYVLLRFEVCEAAPDNAAAWENCPCRTAYPDYSWRAIAMWGWLQSRCIDWLESQSFADMDKLIVTGHSRMGKACLCCGIYDDRAAVVAPAGSGCGGMGSLRRTGSRLGEGYSQSERIGQMAANFPHWFLPEMTQYGSADGTPHREWELPFDGNVLGACVAPRALLLTEGLDDSWSNPFGVQISWQAAAQVYAFLGSRNRCALRFREGGHAYPLTDWLILLDFCGVLLEGAPKATDFKTASWDDCGTCCSWTAPGASPALQDFPSREGFFSIHDAMPQLLANPAAAAVLRERMPEECAVFAKMPMVITLERILYYSGAKYIDSDLMGLNRSLMEIQK